MSAFDRLIRHVRKLKFSRFAHGYVQAYARISLMTCPCTSVSRKSRPP